MSVFGLGISIMASARRAMTGKKPSNITLPVISGTAAVGQTLTTTNGSWSSNAGVPTFAYQWLANGVAIGGATANSYLLTATEQTKTITVQVTASNAVGSTTATSAGVGPVV